MKSNKYKEKIDEIDGLLLEWKKFQPSDANMFGPLYWAGYMDAVGQCTEAMEKLLEDLKNK